MSSRAPELRVPQDAPRDRLELAVPRLEEIRAQLSAALWTFQKAGNVARRIPFELSVRVCSDLSTLAQQIHLLQADVHRLLLEVEEELENAGAGD